MGREKRCTFIEASDLFFFPSKGDKDNKELNPIALKGIRI
jgi:hypothetical protein